MGSSHLEGVSTQNVGVPNFTHKNLPVGPSSLGASFGFRDSFNSVHSPSTLGLKDGHPDWKVLIPKSLADFVDIS